MGSTEHHFLFVIFPPAQGIINPARQLARRLARIAGARVTLSTTISAHRRMFPSSAGNVEEHDDGLISYVPYSDGYDAGFDPKTDNHNTYLSRAELVGAQSLSTLVRSFADRGYPVTYIIYALMTWAADVAHDLGIPSVPFWVQPATVFAICHRYFHGYKDLIFSHKNDPSSSIELPGLQPLQIRDLPSFLTFQDAADDFNSSILSSIETIFRTLDKMVSRSKESKLVMLVNTFEELEPAAISAVDNMDLVAIGPSMDEPTAEVIKDMDMFKEDSRRYMEWLDSKEEGSVVYVSFGSIAKLSKRQMEEIARGLMASGRPYLWVVRQDNGEGGDGLGLGLEGGGGEMGMVVEWCSQVRVLAHRSVGCFVTHCGWNSTFESMVSGVPMVMFPQFTDQMVNARLAEREWGVGVRVEVSGEGEERVMEGRELERCLDVVMGDGERGVEIRRRVKLWQEKAREAAGEGGSSVRNLRAFVEKIGQ